MIRSCKGRLTIFGSGWCHKKVEYVGEIRINKLQMRLRLKEAWKLLLFPSLEEIAKYYAFFRGGSKVLKGLDKTQHESEFTAIWIGIRHFQEITEMDFGKNKHDELDSVSKNFPPHCYTTPSYLSLHLPYLLKIGLENKFHSTSHFFSSQISPSQSRI